MCVDMLTGIMARSKMTTLDPDVRLLAALADSTRLAIVRQLALDQETCACDFTACCDVRQPTVSHHLRVLRDAGVVVQERRGTWIFYRLAPGAAERVRRIAASLEIGALIPAADLLDRRRTARTPPAGSLSAPS
jgi:DNA-binding transcriptional ArsR family regulator